MTIDKFNRLLEIFKEKWNLLPEKENKGMEIKDIICVSETDRERKQGQLRLSIIARFNNTELHELKIPFKSNEFIESSDSDIDIDKFEQELIEKICLDYTIKGLIKQLAEYMHNRQDANLPKPSKKSTYKHELHKYSENKPDSIDNSIVQYLTEQGFTWSDMNHYSSRGKIFTDSYETFPATLSCYSKKIDYKDTIFVCVDGDTVKRFIYQSDSSANIRSIGTYNNIEELKILIDECCSKA